jgi:transposase
VSKAKGGKERMLTMEQIYFIKYLRNHKGKSLRKIAEETGHDFETVKKYTEQADFNLELKKKQQRKGKLDPFKALIDQWLEQDQKAKPKQRHTAQRVFNRLKELYGEEFNVSDRSIRKYVAQKKKELAGGTDGYIPLDHPPGEAQVDFGEAQFIKRGKKYSGYYLNISFPYSNGGYLQIFKAQNQECLLEGLKNILEHIGKTPTSIWFDNMSTAVKEIKKHGERDLTKGFERFMLHYGFSTNFCNPNSGHEKGNIENKVGYNRRNFLVPIPEFDDFEEYNKELLNLCDQDMQRKHYKKSGTIAELFMEDKKAMNSLSIVPFPPVLG